MEIKDKQNNNTYFKILNYVLIIFFISMVFLNFMTSYKLKKDINFLINLEKKIRYNDSIINRTNDIINDINENNKKIDVIMYKIDEIHNNITQIRKKYEREKKNVEFGNIDSLYNKLKNILSEQ